MNIPKELYYRFSSHRVAQFFLYLLFTSDDDGNVKTTLRQMAKDNELSTWRVSNILKELKTLGACQTETKQKTNKEKAKKKVARKNSFDYSFVEPDLQKPFEEWLKYKRIKKQMYKRQCDLELCYKKLKEYSGGDAKKATLIIEQSMTNNWNGLFELKTSTLTTALKSSEMNYDKDNDW